MTLDWNALFRDRGFWAAYYEQHLAADDDDAAWDEDEEDETDPDEVIERVFAPFDPLDSRTAIKGATPVPAGFEDLYNASGTAEKSIELSPVEGMTWRITFVPSAARHSLEDGRGPPLLLGWVGAHSAVPILRLAELEGLVAALEGGWRGPFDRLWIPLLLHPALWLSPADQVETHRQWLTGAWSRADILDVDQIAELVERTTRVEADLAWRRDPRLGWVNNQDWSHRNPRGSWPSTELGEGFAAEKGFERVAAFFRALGVL